MKSNKKERKNKALEKKIISSASIYWGRVGVRFSPRYSLGKSFLVSRVTINRTRVDGPKRFKPSWPDALTWPDWRLVA